MLHPLMIYREVKATVVLYLPDEISRPTVIQFVVSNSCWNIFYNLKVIFWAWVQKPVFLFHSFLCLFYFMVVYTGNNVNVVFESTKMC